MCATLRENSQAFFRETGSLTTLPVAETRTSREGGSPLTHGFSPVNADRDAFEGNTSMRPPSASQPQARGGRGEVGNV